MGQRTPTLQALYDLEIGSELAIHPESGESVKKALNRLKVRVSKWRGDHRSYRLKIVDQSVCARRVEFDQTGVYADWEEMPGGSFLLLKSHPTKADMKKALERCDYLTMRFVTARRNGTWVRAIDMKGRLLVFRAIGSDGEYFPIDELRRGEVEAAVRQSPARLPWAGEWP